MSATHMQDEPRVVRYVKTVSAHLADIDTWYRCEHRRIVTQFPKEDNEERLRLLQALYDECLHRRDLVMVVYESSGEYSQAGLKMMRGAKAHRRDPEWSLPDGTLF